MRSRIGDMVRRGRATTTEARLADLVDRHHAELLGYARRRVEQPADAADVVCEVLLVAWRRIDDVPDGDEARLWLYGVARNVLANHRRSARRRHALAQRLRAHVEAVAPEDPDPTGSPGVAELRDALAQLSADDRELVTLTAWEGLTPSEIGRVTGTEPGTVRVRLHRARSRLRAALRPFDGVQRMSVGGHGDGGRTPVRPGPKEVR